MLVKNLIELTIYIYIYICRCLPRAFCFICFRDVTSKLDSMWRLRLLVLSFTLLCACFAQLGIRMPSARSCFFVYTVFSPSSSFDDFPVTPTFVRYTTLIIVGFGIHGNIIYWLCVAPIPMARCFTSTMV